MFDFTDEQKMFQQLVRKWVEAELKPMNDKLEKNQVLPYDLMRKMAKTFGLPDIVRAAFERMEKNEKTDTPESGMSAARDPSFAAILSMELSRENPGFCMSFGASVGLAGGAIMAKGTPRQKRKWALPVLTMEKIGAWGMTEPGAGSDAFRSMRTVAVPRGDGVPHRVGEVHRLPTIRERAPVGQRQRVQILDEAGQAVRLVRQRRDIVLVERPYAVLQRFDLGAEHRQWRP